MLCNRIRDAARVGVWVLASCCLAMSLALAVGAEEPKPAPAPAAQAPAKAVVPTWYVSAVVSGRTGYRVTHYWSQGANYRAQTMVGIHPVTTIVRGDRYWSYDALSKAGIEIKRSDRALAEDAKALRPFGNDLAKLIQSDGEKVGTELIAGVSVEVWRVTNDTGRRTVWATVAEPRVVLRVENFDRETGESATLNYSNWASGFDLPSDAFVPPSDLRLQRFDYAQYVEKALTGLVGSVPVLYPILLHGPPSE